MLFASTACMVANSVELLITVVVLSTLVGLTCG